MRSSEIRFTEAERAALATGAGSVAREANAERARDWSGAEIRVSLTYLLLVLIAVVTIGPFWMMVSASLRPHLIYLAFPMPLIPPDVDLSNYARLFDQSSIARWILNSAFITVSVTALNLATCSMAGFAFARGRFPGRDAIFWLFMATLMIPSTVTIIPLFVVVAKLGWANTYAGLIVPNATSIFGTFLIRQFFKTIPLEYDDAAHIDGANRWQIFYWIDLPLVKPALATLATLTFLGAWNDFLYPLIITSSDEMRPLTVGLATLVTRTGDAGFTMAGATVSFVPTFIFFLTMQRYIVRGIALSGIKG
jgi:multiple sugar transport system permease protein